MRTAAMIVFWIAALSYVGYRWSLSWRAARLERDGRHDEARPLRERSFHLYRWVVSVLVVLMLATVVVAVAT